MSHEEFEQMLAAYDQADREALARWRDGLKRRGDLLETPYLTHEANAILTLRMHPSYKGLVGFNVMTHKPQLMRSVTGAESSNFKPRELTEKDKTSIIAALQSPKDKNDPSLWFSRPVMDAAIDVVAEDILYDPLVRYLNSVSWSGSLRDAEDFLETALYRYFGAKAQSPEQDRYIRAVSKRFLIGAVARAYEPSVQMDTVLMLDSPQGTGKSSTLRILGGEFFGDQLPGFTDASDRNLSFYMSSKWIIELKELGPLAKANDDQKKAFFDRRVEEPREMHDKNTLKYERRCVFVGTHNNRKYLTDRTGNRRYWSVTVGECDPAALRSERNRLWAAAAAAYRAGVQWHLTEEEKVLARIEQGERIVENEFTAPIAKWLDQGHAKGVPLTTASIGTGALGQLPGQVRGRLAGQIGDAMRELGYRDRHTNKGTVWELAGDKSGEKVTGNLVPFHHPQTRRKAGVLTYSDESDET